MTFTIRDLMLDVLPAADAEAHQLYLCVPITDPTQPKPGPKPKPGPPHPKPKPQCVPISTGPGGFADDYLVANAELTALAVLRDQLHQALRP